MAYTISISLVLNPRKFGVGMGLMFVLMMHNIRQGVISIGGTHTLTRLFIGCVFLDDFHFSHSYCLFRMKKIIFVHSLHFML